MTRRSIGGQSRTKAYVTFGLRALVIAGLALALSHPNLVKRGKGLTVTVLLDRSQSIPVPLKKSALNFLERAVEAKERPEDRVAVITVNRDAHITAMPDPLSAVTVGSDEGDPAATDLAAGVRMALAIMPDDTANRIVLASDGNETVDSVLAAAEVAEANGVPIDVLVLKYDYPNEVIFEQIVAPTRARQGQTARVRLVLRSQGVASGTVRLRMNSVYLDLNGDEEGDGLHVELPPGVTALEQVIALDDSGPHQFDAVFIPDEPGMDAIERNNRAVAVTFVGGHGKVLIVSEEASQAAYLVEALREAGITAEIRASNELSGGLVFLSGYDAVMLVNIPRWSFDQTQDMMLHSYVHDLGGGLAMIGGAQSFGAGGWIDSDLAKALPVRLNPPDKRQMPAGALALIMHSCEMPQGNFWGQKVAEASIEALSRLDYVGIVEFAWGAANQGCSWAFPMQRLGDKRAALQATKTMTVGDMPAFGPSMSLALQGLTGTTAAQRHAIIISDGDPSPPSPALLQSFVDNRVTVTTVMVGGHGTALDKARMRAVANKTGGQFYDVKNPKQLPQIFIKEAQIVSRSLIQDGDTYTPTVVSNLPGPTRGFSGVPAIDGYVLTAAREGLAQTPIVISTTEGNDPLFAYWNYGLGRTVAYTSDLTELWGSRWASWERFQVFWEQVVRWTLRPSSPMNMDVVTRMEGDQAIVEVQALEADASSLNFLRTSGVMVRPDATAEPLSLQQTGPGRYRGQFSTDAAGAYLVNVAYESGSGETLRQGHIQAAVTVPYAREFRAVKHNEALLVELARRTGGRVLTGDDPDLVGLFDRGDLAVPRSLKRVWDLLAILAACILILDVAARRISVDPKRAAAVAGKAIGRRADVSTDTVAAWKRTRSQVAHRRDEPADARAARRAQRGARGAARFEATEEDLGKAIDVGGGKPADRGPKPAARTEPPKTGTSGADADDGDYTSRLLAAKRRARGEERDAGGDAGGGAGDAESPGGKDA